MSKYNRGTATVRYATGVPAQVETVIKTELSPTGRTFEGAPGFARDVKSELFVLAVSSFGEDNFYEKSSEQYTRFRDLIRAVAVADPDWTRRFLYWLRNDAYIRTGSLVGALEAADAMVKARIQGSRNIVSSVLVRADEPGEALAYWQSVHGRRIPKPIKRGIADAAVQLYTEFNWLKQDSTRAAFRFADVIELTHPIAKGTVQNALFEFILNTRHGRKDVAILEVVLKMVSANMYIRRQVEQGNYTLLTNPEIVKGAGLTWEDVLSLGGSHVDKAQMWQALFPTLGYMAMLRNLRNFDQAGISQAMINGVIAKLTDPEQVARSKQFPFRFLSAYRAVQSQNWGRALETALNLSLSNVPQLSGRTLVLVDRSGSMFARASERSELTRADQAALFGTVLALRNFGSVDLVEFGSDSRAVPISIGDSLLKVVDERFHDLGGTYTRGAVTSHYKAHDRVVIVTDEQSHDGDPGSAIPAHVPLYTWNLAGYKRSSTAGKPRRFTFGGLTDQAFTMMQMLENGENQSWPF